MLKHACQIYVMKYLSTIRRVFDYKRNSDSEGDCSINNNHNENEYDKRNDLM